MDLTPNMRNLIMHNFVKYVTILFFAMLYKIKITPLKAEDDTAWAKEHTDLLSYLCPLAGRHCVIEAY